MNLITELADKLRDEVVVLNFRDSDKNKTEFSCKRNIKFISSEGINIIIKIDTVEQLSISLKRENSKTIVLSWKVQLQEEDICLKPKWLRERSLNKDNYFIIYVQNMETNKVTNYTLISRLLKGEQRLEEVDPDVQYFASVVMLNSTAENGSFFSCVNNNSSSCEEFNYNKSFTNNIVNPKISKQKEAK